MKFVKMNKFWWKYDEQTPLNNATIYGISANSSMSSLDLTTAKIVEANSWQHLNWQGTYLLNNKFKTGWLSPDGTFFGCEKEYHNMQAHLLHKKSEQKLEQEGFIKITKVMEYSPLIAIFSGKEYNKKLLPTLAQIEYLKKQQGVNSSEVFSLFKENDNTISR